MPTIRQSQNVSVVEEGISPRTRRWGLMPPMFVAEMEPRESGQSERSLTPGRILFETASRREQNFNINDEEFTLEENKERPAKFYIDNVKKQYAPFGFVELEMLTPLEDEVADSYFDMVHGPLDVNACPERNANCAHCRIADLESRKYKGIPEDLRLRTLQSYVIYHDYARERWGGIVGEREDRKSGRPGMSKFGEAEHHLRKHIHAVNPDLEAAHSAKAYGEQGAQATVEGMKAIAESLKGNQGSDKMAEAILRMAETQAENNKLLAQIVANQNGVSATVTDNKVGKRTKAYKDSVRDDESSTQTGNESPS